MDISFLCPVLHRGDDISADCGNGLFCPHRDSALQIAEENRRKRYRPTGDHVFHHVPGKADAVPGLRQSPDSLFHPSVPVPGLLCQGTAEKEVSVPGCGVPLPGNPVLSLLPAGLFPGSPDSFYEDKGTLEEHRAVYRRLRLIRRDLCRIFRLQNRGPELSSEPDEHFLFGLPQRGGVRQSVELFLWSARGCGMAGAGRGPCLAPGGRHGEAAGKGRRLFPRIRYRPVPVRTCVLVSTEADGAGLDLYVLHHTCFPDGAQLLFL